MPGKSTGRLNLNILCGAALRFQHIPGLAQPIELHFPTCEIREPEESTGSVCVFPAQCCPSAPSAVATIVYRAVQIYFCSASLQLFRCSLENETNTDQQLAFPFQTGTPFSSDPEDKDCFKADSFTWRSQGQVNNINNITAAVEKCHWQSEKV